MEVPSTKTWVDRQADKKKLEGEITILTSTKDTAHRETKEAVKAADVSRETLKSLNTDIEKISAIFDTATTDTLAHIVMCQKLINENKAPLDGFLKLYGELAKKCREADENLKQIESAGIAIHEKCVKDLEMVDVARYDIKVYQSRLQEYFSRYLPGQKIIL